MNTEKKEKKKEKKIEETGGKMKEAEPKKSLKTEDENIEVIEGEIVEPEEDKTIDENLIAIDEAWKPRTELGRKVKSREITSIDEILEMGAKIMEPEIVDSLIHLETDFLLVGQAKGKFGGGKRRVFRQTQKKTREGNKPRFQTTIVVGDMNGHVGLGTGKAKDTMPAKEKAIRKAKLSIFRIKRGCGSWRCNCGTEHSIPFAVEGKSGSITIKLIPAPKGKGIVAEKESAKILKMAGISDIWVKSTGHTATKANVIKACISALKKLEQVNVLNNESGGKK